MFEIFDTSHLSKNPNFIKQALGLDECTTSKVSDSSLQRNCLILRVEYHPAHAKNSGLLTQKLLAASNGELYTAM